MERGEIDDAAHKVWSEQAGKMYPKELLDKVLAARDEYRAKHK